MKNKIFHAWNWNSNIKWGHLECVKLLKKRFNVWMAKYRAKDIPCCTDRILEKLKIKDKMINWII